MASSCSPADAKRSIERAGFYLVEDEIEDTGRGKGRLFAKFYDDGYRTKTPEGLDFIVRNTIGDSEIGEIVRSSIDSPRWGYLRFFSDLLSSEYAWFFHVRHPTNNYEAIHTIQVQFWMPGSKVIYYEGSQLQSFDAEEDPENWGVLRTPLSNMERDGIVKRVVDLPNGGYTIIDSRLGWTCDQGKFINVGYGTEDEVRTWGKMPLPDTEALRAKHAELEAAGYRTNFTFVKYDS